MNEYRPTPKSYCFAQLEVGDRARVIGFGGLTENYRNRLMSLGMVPGTEFVVRHVAPLGDPVDIHMRGFSLSLRRDEAAGIEVEKV